MPTSIGRTLNDSTHPVLAEAASRYRALTPLNSAWKEAVEDSLARHAQPKALRDGTLTVHAESPVWANLIRNNEQTIVAALRDTGLTGVQTIRVRIAPPNLSPDPPPADEREDDNNKFRRLFEQLRKALG